MIKTTRVPKGTIILNQGEVCKSGYRIISGCLKSYIISSSGKEHILQFAPEDWLISDIESLATGSKSKVYIDAVEDTEFEIFDNTNFVEIERMDREMLVTLSYKLRNSLIATNKRLLSLLSSSAEERYIEFKNTYPQLVQRLPQKLIASYLGMTPEHLSAVRSKLVKNI